jgi:N-acetyl sugar amidotransferase
MTPIIGYLKRNRLLAMKYCVRCLNMTTRPNTSFSQNGLCPACVQFSSPSAIDWKARTVELEEIKRFGRKHSESGYDCIIGVSGGKDSTLQALFVRDALGMNPLLVSLNYPPDQMSDLGARNISNLINLGFDCVNIGCSPQIWKDLVKAGFYQFGNWAKSTEMALFSSVPRLAISYQIPLIWWGENASVMLGDMKVAGKSPSDGNRLKYGNTLNGGNIEWMYKIGYKPNQLIQYQYPSDEDMERANLRIVFLAHFWQDFTPYINGNLAALRGLSIRTPDPQNADFWGTSMLDEDFMLLNMMIKWLKFGFGKASDNINEEIRAGRISREDGIKIVEQFDGRCPTHVISDFCNYIGITVGEFWNVVDKFVNKELFTRVSEGVYRKKFKVGVSLA